MIHNFKDLNLKKYYDSDKNNLLHDFFIPALSASVKYNRLAGFFSSGILSAASRGITEFIKQNGKMQMIVGVQIHEEDFEMLKLSDAKTPEFIEQMINTKIPNIDDFLRDKHVEALGWMLANDLLDLKLAVTANGGLFHMKVGLLEDHDGNQLSFSGSDNETPSGWKHNIEEFKVFRSWIDSEKEYFEADKEKFDRFWSGRGERVIVSTIPEALRKKIIRSVPKKKEGLRLFRENDNDVSLNENRKSHQIQLRPHQSEAIKKWNQNHRRGILAMATGSGKTKTAVSIIKELIDEGKPLCTVIAVPYTHLARQWIKEDVNKQFPDIPLIEANSTNSNWKQRVKLMLRGYSKGLNHHLIIVATYATLSSDDFINYFRDEYNSTKDYLIIADEVHNLGAKKTQSAMLDQFNYRLGLTATPQRHFDDVGTDKIIKYFNSIVYEYSLADAIRDGFLVRYKYFPKIVEMSEEEYEKYYEISQKIRRRVGMLNISSGESIVSDDSNLQKLFQQRSKIIKESEAKIPALKEIIGNLKKNHQEDHLLIYCDNNQQLDECQSILNDEGIISHTFTQDEKPSEREKILRAFAENQYQCLVAIKCLDEGVDVPSIKTAIIVASTTNPREYIQRRGRVLRKDSSKDKAYIFDFIVMPPLVKRTKIDQYEKQILKKELARVIDFVQTADNKAEIYDAMIGVMNKYDSFS